MKVIPRALEANQFTVYRCYMLQELQQAYKSSLQAYKSSIEAYKAQQLHKDVASDQAKNLFKLMSNNKIERKKSV